MKKTRLQKMLSALQNAVRIFALYGAIPLVCGGMVGLVIFIRSAGSGQAQTLLAQAGERSLVSVIGGIAVKSETSPGFYFLTDELLPPMHEATKAILGTGTYFSHDPLKLPATEQEDKAESEKKPVADVIYNAVPTGAKPIIACDLSSKSFCINTTGHSVDIEAAKKADFPSETTFGDEPLVLVLHTHGTEGYFEDNTNLSEFAPDGVDGYFLPDQMSFRTTDPKKSVVRVGDVFTETLISCGVPAIHVSTMHDRGDFNNAYSKSAETVKKTLEKYPSIQYVVDLHRDSVVRGDSYVKSFTTVENTPTAQVMLVVGTDKHENWEKNLTVAASFKQQMDKQFPSLSRALYLRTARYNQQYLPGCLLLEVGSAANTLEEAENAARFAARAFSEMLKNEK